MARIKKMEFKDVSKEDRSKSKKINDNQCKICDYVCYKASNLSKHVKSCSYYSKFMKEVKNGVQCLLCDFEMPQKRENYKFEMYRHIKKRHYNLIDEQKEENLKNGIQQNKKCSYCGLIMKNYNNFLSHIKACKLYNECEFLEKTLSGFYCTKCSAYFQKTSIHVHMKNKHTEYYLEKNWENSSLKFEQESPKYQNNLKCENCNETVDYKNYYANHITSCKLYWKYIEKLQG